MATTPTNTNGTPAADESLDYSMTMSGDLNGLLKTPKASTTPLPRNSSNRKNANIRKSGNNDDLPPTIKQGSASKFLTMAAQELELEESTGDNNLLKAAQMEAGSNKKPMARRASTARTLLAASSEVEDTINSTHTGSNKKSSPRKNKAAINTNSNNNDENSFQNMLAAATMPKRSISPSKKNSRGTRNAPPSRKSKSSNNLSFNKIMRSSGDLADTIKLSKSQQVIMSMTRQMGKPAKSKQRKSTTSKADLRDSWERLSAPVSHSDDQVARRLKGMKKFGRADDAKNCTFQPKCKGWKGGETKEPEDDDHNTDDAARVLRMFVKRQDNWTSVTRKAKQFEIDKRNYELRLDRWQCRNCGTFQAYSEFLKKEFRCPADICGGTQYYQPQEVFNRDVYKKIRRLVDKTYGEEGEVDEERLEQVQQKLKGLEPSEKCVVERYMRDVKESKMTEEQKEARSEELKFIKQKKLDDEKAEREYKERMIQMAIEKANDEQEFIAKEAADLVGTSVRKIYDKEEKKVISVEYKWDQPVNKIIETTVEVTNPETEETIEIPATVKVPYYDDGEGNAIKKYWDGPQSLLDDGEAIFTKEEFFERLADDSTKRRNTAKNNEDKNLGKIGTINKARMVKNQLEQEATINEKLAEAVEARDLMAIRRAVHEAGTLRTPLQSTELDQAIRCERDLVEEIRLLKEGQEAVAKEDMDGVNTWLKRVKHRKRTKLETIKFRLRRLDRVERFITESKQDDPKFDEWVEDLSNRREQLEREREAVLSNSEKNEEVGEMREKLETDKDVLDRLKNAMREKNLEMVVEVLEEAEELGLHLLPSSNARADGSFFERLERESSKRKGRIWGSAKVVHINTIYGREETYDIEFGDGVVQEGVRRGALKAEGDGDDDEDYEDEEGGGSDDEGESKNEYMKPRRPILKVGTEVVARRTRGPGIDIPASNEYNIFRAEDVNCAPVILRKLNRRLRAIRNYLDKHPNDKKSPMTAQMYAYAKQRQTILQMCEYAHVDVSSVEEKENDLSDDEDDDYDE